MAKKASKKILEGRENGIDFYLQLRGRLYSLRFTDPRSHIEQRIPTKKTDPQDARFFAENFLRNYVPGQGTTRVTVGELVETLLRFKQTHQSRDFKYRSINWNKRLAPKFSNWDYRDLTSDVVTDYKAWGLDMPIDEFTTPLRKSWPRIDTPISKATINLDLALLSKAYNDAKPDKISYSPKWKKYSKEELGVRTVMVLMGDLDRIMALDDGDLPLWLRGLLQVYYDGGFRYTELTEMRVSQFDNVLGGFQLAAGHNGEEEATEKNGQGRWAPLSEAGWALVKRLCEGKQGNDLVFARENGVPAGDFRQLFATVLKRAGIDRELHIHDFRRTAITEFHQAGVDQKLIMDAVGHKTPHVNWRYRITDKEKLVAAMRKKEQWQREQRNAAPQEDQLAALQRQLDESKARELQLTAAIQALQSAIANLGTPQVGVFTKPVAKSLEVQ